MLHFVLVSNAEESLERGKPLTAYGYEQSRQLVHHLDNICDKNTYHNIEVYTSHFLMAKQTSAPFSSSRLCTVSTDSTLDVNIAKFIQNQHVHHFRYLGNRDTPKVIVAFVTSSSLQAFLIRPVQDCTIVKLEILCREDLDLFQPKLLFYNKGLEL